MLSMRRRSPPYLKHPGKSVASSACNRMHMPEKVATTSHFWLPTSPHTQMPTCRLRAMACAHAVKPRAPHHRQPATRPPEDNSNSKIGLEPNRLGNAGRRQAVQHADAGRARGAGHEEAVGILAQVALRQPELAAAAARAHPAASAGRRGSARTCGCARPVLATALGCSGRSGSAGPPLHIVQIHLQRNSKISTGSVDSQVHCSRTRVSPMPSLPRRALLSVQVVQLTAIGWSQEGRQQTPTCSATASSACSARSATCRSYAARPRSLRSTCTSLNIQHCAIGVQTPPATTSRL